MVYWLKTASSKSLSPAAAVIRAACFILAWPFLVEAQVVNKTFSVAPGAGEVEVVNQIGTIKVTSAGAQADRVTIVARQLDGEPKINATQSPQGKVKIEVSGRGTVDFELTAPAGAKLDLLTYKGNISVGQMTGPVRARITTDGNILLTGLRSSRVEAHCHNGNVSFSGELLAQGDYMLKSFSGRVDATFPPNSDFKLSALTFKGGLDLGGFPLKYDRQTKEIVEAVSGAGKSKVYLWTQEGSIHLHRQP